ncbi:MAG TPA: D-glycero-beta-D-manno-heptose-7-phosphate kinase [Steroidobacteraceae bacterium]|jgi:D-beta-D-heptose 7-phosphate kinase/D-beta-D-heptose 1-phosphate adenosyltransferase|nr:D-glycero-beta-D-manno-heptose-7-phosphate kinase [Steroidobacteraceae bacterium]
MSTLDLWDLLDSFHRTRVLVVGDLMVDRFIYGTVERISPEAPVPVMTISRTAAMPGGAANVARNVATLGAQAVLLGVVGADAAAEELRAQLAALPTIRPELIVDGSRPTTLKTRHIADRQQILRTDVEERGPLSGAIAAALLERFQAALANTDVVVLSDYAKGVLSDEVAAGVIAAARSAGRPVLVDPKSRTFAKYRGAAVLTPNRHELEAACGQTCGSDEAVVAGACGILADGICDTLVVTRGADGMSIIPAQGAPQHMRTTAREVFDVSGAGDTAVAVMALGLARGAALHDAVRLANVAAAIVVGKRGTATVTTGEIIAHLEQLGLGSFEGESTRGADGHASPKHFTLESVGQLVSRWREHGLKIAFTNGCFDLLHPGHVSLLEQARASADRLVVGLNSDLSVRRLKGPGRPVQSEAARATVLASLKSVDAVVIFPQDTPLELIGALAPDVLIKGADYRVDTVVGSDLVLQRGGKVLLIDLVPAHSTTSTIERMTAALQR